MGSPRLVRHQVRARQQSTEAGSGRDDTPPLTVWTQRRTIQLVDGEELDAREAARIRRRDRDAEAEGRDLMRPGMGKVFKQIQDVQRRAADDEAPTPRRKRRG